MGDTEFKKSASPAVGGGNSLWSAIPTAVVGISDRVYCALSAKASALSCRGGYLRVCDTTEFRLLLELYGKMSEISAVFPGGLIAKMDLGQGGGGLYRLYDSSYPPSSDQRTGRRPQIRPRLVHNQRSPQ